jgi:hypothetical protein
LNFLSKHYEKIVLALFLLVFVFSLVYLIVVFSKSTEITEADLMVRPEGREYERLFNDDGTENVSEGEKPKYAVLKELADEPVWRKSVKRNENDDIATDLLIPFQAARCQGCHKIIPCISYKKKKCPLCGCVLGEIKAPPKSGGGGGDTDKDGMPDVYEAAHHLDIKNPGDKWEDLDEDGFPNFTEFKADTNPDDAKSHPPLADRLRLAALKRKKLNVKLVNVITYNSKIKSKWVVQLKLVKRRKWRDAFRKIGDNLTLDSKGLEVYEIKDIIYKVEEVFDKNLGQPMPKNVSVMILQNAMDKSDKPIKVRIGKPVYANKVVLVFEDTFNEKRYSAKEGGQFTVGDAASGRRIYTVLSLNMKEKTVVIKDKTGKKFTIGRKSKLQTVLEAANVEKAKSSEERPGGVMEDPAMMMDRRGSRGSRRRTPSRRGGPFDPMMPPR